MERGVVNFVTECVMDMNLMKLEQNQLMEGIHDTSQSRNNKD